MWVRVSSVWVKVRSVLMKVSSVCGGEWCVGKGEGCVGGSEQCVGEGEQCVGGVAAGDSREVSSNELTGLYSAFAFSSASVGHKSDQEDLSRPTFHRTSDTEETTIIVSVTVSVCI